MKNIENGFRKDGVAPLRSTVVLITLFDPDWVTLFDQWRPENTVLNIELRCANAAWSVSLDEQIKSRLHTFEKYKTDGEF